MEYTKQEIIKKLKDRGFEDIVTYGKKGEAFHHELAMVIDETFN